MASIDDVDQLRRNPDDAVAANWYLRAARLQQPDAVYALGTLYLAGRGVQKDYLRAYVLCNVALAGGIVAAFIAATMPPAI